MKKRSDSPVLWGSGCYCFLALGLLLSAALSPALALQPNIVFLLADDLGYGDLGCYGGNISTPHLDQLGRQGVRLTQFYANGPECTPTRTALLTGRYQQRAGGLECAIGVGNVGRYDDAIRLCTQSELGLPVTESALGRLLHEAGWQTACIGKWHLGYEPKFFPRQHGFDYWFGPIGGATDYFHHVEPGGLPALYQNGRPIQREGYLTDLITAEAVRFIEQAHDGPFFLYVPYTAPHTPIQGPEDRRDQPVSAAHWNKGTPQIYAAMVRRLDQSVGAILSALDQQGFHTNTLVIFTSDNGGTKLARNTPFSGTKGTLFEGGIRVPCLIRWPGVLPAAVVSDQVSITMDLTASLVGLAGEHPLKPFDGMDLINALRSGASSEPRTLFWRARRGEVTWRAVRDGSMKYVSKQTGPKTIEHLFDLSVDREEKHNLLKQHPEEVYRLKEKLARWEAKVQPGR